MNLIKIVEGLEAEYFNSDQFVNPLPNEVQVQQDNKKHLIDITFKDEVLKTNIWNGEEQYYPTEKEVNYIYNYLQTLLVYEIDRTKKYYQENEYNFNQWLTND